MAQQRGRGSSKAVTEGEQERSEGTGGMGWRGTQDTQAWRLRGGGTTQDTGLAEASGQLGTEEMH